LEEPTSNLVRNHTQPHFETAAHSGRFADIQEGTPTADQLTNIFEYLGRDKIGSVVEGASSPTEALRKLKENGSVFQRPVVVDWGNGRAGNLTPC
jgi:arsenate reductase-like glutaredoxin family protein